MNSRNFLNFVIEKMSTVSKPQNEILTLAEYICTHYNTKLKCPSCRKDRLQGAFNRDQGKKGPDGKPFRRFVCKGKSSGECSKSLGSIGFCILARDQLEGEVTASLLQRFPTAWEGLETAYPKRPRDSAPTGLTPQGKRVFIGADRSIPPPPFFPTTVGELP